MATFELEESATPRPVARGAGSIFGQVFAPIQRWNLRRQTIAHLSGLNEHLRRDVGFEPADAYDPLDGGIAAVWKRPHLRPDIR